MAGWSIRAGKIGDAILFCGLVVTCLPIVSPGHSAPPPPRMWRPRHRCAADAAAAAIDDAGALGAESGIVKPQGWDGRPWREDMAGLCGRLDGGGTGPRVEATSDGRVVVVREGDKGMCERGDEIKAVDGIPAWQLGPRGVSAMLACRNGEMAMIDVKRGKDTFRVAAHEGEGWRYDRAEGRWETGDVDWAHGVNCRDDVIARVQSMYRVKFDEGGDWRATPTQLLSVLLAVVASHAVSLHLSQNPTRFSLLAQQSHCPALLHVLTIYPPPCILPPPPPDQRRGVACASSAVGALKHHAPRLSPQGRGCLLTMAVAAVVRGDSPFGAYPKGWAPCICSCDEVAQCFPSPPLPVSPFPRLPLPPFPPLPLFPFLEPNTHLVI